MATLLQSTQPRRSLFGYTKKCVCGHSFTSGSAFCSRCGQKRPDLPLADVEVKVKRQSAEESLGLKLALVRDTVYHIQSVDAEGLVHAWNASCGDDVMRTVMPGDLVVAVNSVAHDAALMLEEMARMSVILSIAHGESRTRMPEGPADCHPDDVRVNVVKEEDEALGLGCDESAHGNFLLIRQVCHTGAVARWNAKVKDGVSRQQNITDGPLHIVRAGDRIISVNGVSGRKGKQALEVLRSERTLKLVIRPSPCNAERVEILASLLHSEAITFDEDFRPRQERAADACESRDGGLLECFYRRFTCTGRFMCYDSHETAEEDPHVLQGVGDGGEAFQVATTVTPEPCLVRGSAPRA
eukprot:TRINITY_DN9832_c0_g1_i2.p1 TRINITY_DN9832_c0_g1~~TRINITY_DN9832_c0_g1_i2.p1  ORF type:complete len:355 (+),score=62.92 TRINITY_DN9832_c0_g1_i2:107-1171(+)